MTDRIALEWTPRETVLPARAVVGIGDVARALGLRLVSTSDEQLAALTAVAGADVLVVLGDSAQLPWVDGVMYVGRDDAAPELLLPTALQPTVAAPLLAAGFRRLTTNAPIVVVPTPQRLIPCGMARAIDRERLRAWLEGP